MFVVDYFSAFLLAGAFTVAFDGALKAVKYGISSMTETA